MRKKVTAARVYLSFKTSSLIRCYANLCDSEKKVVNALLSKSDAECI